LRKVSFYYYSDHTCLVSTRASIFAFSPHTCCGDCLAAFPLLNLYREKSNVSCVLNLEGGNNTCHRPKRARSAGTVLPECWPRGESLYCSLRLLVCFVFQSLLYLQNDTSICMPSQVVIGVKKCYSGEAAEVKLRTTETEFFKYQVSDRTMPYRMRIIVASCRWLRAQCSAQNAITKVSRCLGLSWGCVGTDRQGTPSKKNNSAY
jgi:hypothetical protein